MTTLKELATTGRTKTAETAGSATGSTALEPTKFLKELVDAAKERQFGMSALQIHHLPKGTADLVIPYRSKYLGSTGIDYATSTPNVANEINATKIDNLDGVTCTPAMQASRVSIGNYAISVNALNLIQAAKDELIYSIGDKVDQYIFITLGDATSSTSSLAGMQVLYGGDATSGTTLSTGDVITTDLVAEARKLLMTKNKQYRATAAGSGGGYGAVQSGSIVGNPWSSNNSEPFILFIGPSQEEAFLKDSQFVNAAEYGAREALLNGEIGKYLGIKIVSTSNVEQIASGVEAPDEQSATAGANMTRCLLVKAKVCGAFVWGRDPKLSLFDHIIEVSQEIVLETSYICKVIHTDGIVAIDVTDA